MRAEMMSIDDLHKARSHKYLRRLGAPKAYRYVYKEEDRRSPYAKQFDLKERRVNRAIAKLVEGKTMKMERPFGLHYPTEKEMDHEQMRIGTMSEKALMARMYKIKDPQKLYAFELALENENMHGMAADAGNMLAEMGYSRGGDVIAKPKATALEQPYMKHKGGLPRERVLPKAEKKAVFTVFTGGPKPGEVSYKHVDMPEKKARALPAKGEVLKPKGEEARAPRHIVLMDEPDTPQHEAYRQALLAKEKKDGFVKKDKAGNIIKEPKEDVLEPSRPKKIGISKLKAQYAKKLKEEDPWKDMPGYGKTYKMQAPFKKKGRMEAYGMMGMKNKPWRKEFPSLEAYHKWLDKNEGNVKVLGTRDLEEIEYGKTYKMQAPFRKLGSAIPVAPHLLKKIRRMGSINTPYGKGSIENTEEGIAGLERITVRVGDKYYEFEPEHRSEWRKLEKLN